jgi:hypothetical protein
MFQEGLTLPSQQGFGGMIGQRLQAGTQSGRQYHRFIFLGLHNHLSLGDCPSHLAQTYFIFLSASFTSNPSFLLHSFLLIQKLLWRDKS